MKKRIIAIFVCVFALILSSCGAMTASDDTEMTRVETAGTGTAAPYETDDPEKETVPPLETVTEMETETASETKTEIGTEVETEAETEPVELTYGNAYASPGFMRYLSDNYGEGTVKIIKESVNDGSFDKELYYSLTHKSVYVLLDEYNGVENKKSRVISCAEDGVIGFGFCGDIMFCDGIKAMKRYVDHGNDVNALIPAELIDIMKSYDVLFANNEFCASDRGEALNKSFTFRGKPENLALYHEIGVDFVSAANNHIYDYGRNAFLDTLDSLDRFGIDHAGAGKNINEAKEPFIYIANGRKIAVLCGSRAEKNRKTPLAGIDTAGVFGMYDDGDMTEAVKKADAECDLVVIIAHWGAEFSTEIEDIIRVQGRHYIDAGADLIVGAHAHTLQGMEFYKEKLIAYNIGEFLFGNANVKTGILQIRINAADMTYSASFVPCIQDTDHVRLCKGDEAGCVLSFLSSVAPDVKIRADGSITEK